MGRKTILVTIALLAGCSNPPARSPFTSRDSVGVQIVESWAPLWQDGGGWVLGESEILDLTTSGNGPAHEFYRVVGATCLSDGRIVVANRGSSEIRMFSSTGAPLASVGREGDGPGEYRSISGMFRLRGDTIGVFSWPTILTLLSPDLVFMRSVRLGDRARRPHPLENGGVVDLEVFASVVEYEGREQLIRPPTHLVLWDQGGHIVDTLWSGPGFEDYMVPDEDGVSSWKPIFGKQVAFATRGSSVLVGTSEAMEYQVLDLDGRIQQIVRVPDYDLTLPQSAIDAERAWMLGPDPSSRLRTIVENIPAPRTYPAYSEFLVDAKGYLWVGGMQTAVTLGAQRRWEVFTPEGQWMGPIQTPSRFTVLEIGVDYVLGVFRDDLDVEHVQFLPLTRTSQGGRF